ncbi:pentapeptide repeat-containing protein [Streptomyces sp. NPDC001046]|uniref:pentapeptide repeat-containing protein n=1 Tax=Streptomyces sp. NPDC001046 TaxID=3364543 RepID=UPI0036D14ED5
MTHPSPPPLPPARNWPVCGHGATVEDPVGCPGVHAGSHTACLAHLNETDRAAYLDTLSPGADIDHRGTPFTQDLLHRLLTALRDPATHRPRTGAALFDGATFAGDPKFDEVTFSGEVRFPGAAFTGRASFAAATVTDQAVFGGAAFAGRALFAGAAFTRDAQFEEVTFTGDADLRQAVFTGDLRFDRARFEAASRVGPLVCRQRVVLDGAVFEQPVTLEVAARRVSCARTWWASTATLHLRHAELDLRDAVLEHPVVISARPTPFPSPGLPETELSGLPPGVRLTTLGGVDAAHLALHDIDLSECRFAGAVHLDQLKVDGWCTFPRTPTGAGRRFPWRWARRDTLAEEHHWRVRTARHPALARGWTPPPEDAPELRPAAVAALYRQLRKSLEDGKNEPGAAHFYVGECEMRRRDADITPWSERALLGVYWALSGYGLRASRALACLVAAMTVTLAVMVLWGLPADAPEPTVTGRRLVNGQQVEAARTTETSAPANPTGPLAERITTDRFEKALRVVINSVAFRSSGQDLTIAGTYSEMASRLVEPVLLGMAVLAVRSRVKR